MASMSLAGSRASYDSGYMVCVSPGAYAVFFFFSTRRRTWILRSSVFSLACLNHAQWRSVHSLSASSLFSHLKFGHYVMSPLYLAVLVRCLGVLLAQCLVRLWIHICVFWCSSLVGRRHVRCCATTGLWSDSGENCGLRSCIPRCGRCPGWQVVQILWCKCEGDSRLPQMLLIRTRFWTRSLTCLRCVTAGAWSSVQKLRILRSCSSSTRCGRPCDLTATSRFSSTVEVPPIQFTARVVVSCCTTEIGTQLSADALWRR